MTCQICLRPIVGRHRAVQPFQPRVTSLVFHRKCWRDIRRAADAAERSAWDQGDRLPGGIPCECGRAIFPGVDHHCSGVVAAP